MDCEKSLVSQEIVFLRQFRTKNPETDFVSVDQCPNFCREKERASLTIQA